MKWKTLICQNTWFFIQLFLGNIKALIESKKQKWKEKSKWCNSLDFYHCTFSPPFHFFPFFGFVDKIYWWSCSWWAVPALQYLIRDRSGQSYCSAVTGGRAASAQLENCISVARTNISCFSAGISNTQLLLIQ